MTWQMFVWQAAIKYIWNMLNVIWILMRHKYLLSTAAAFLLLISKNFLISSTDFWCGIAQLVIDCDQLSSLRVVELVWLCHRIDPVEIRESSPARQQNMTCDRVKNVLVAFFPSFEPIYHVSHPFKMFQLVYLPFTFESSKKKLFSFLIFTYFPHHLISPHPHRVHCKCQN